MPKKLLLFMLLISVLICAGCGGGGGGKKDRNPYGGCIIPSPEDNDVFSSLGGGRVVDVSRFNNVSVYTTITALPKNKWEGDYVEPPIFSGTLVTTTGVAQNRILNAFKNRSAGSLSSNLFPKQAMYDQLMRQAENDALAGRAQQLSKKRSDIYFSAPKPIIEDTTTWEGVYVLSSTGSFVQIDTTCKYVSEHAYFFVDKRDINTINLDLLKDYGNAFDKIYETIHENFGTENDVDDNGKVIIVFTKELTGGLLGYFYGNDKYARSDSNKNSNEGDIFYLTTDTDYEGIPIQGNIIKATLAHEFQHMIYFDQHYNRGVAHAPIWLNEALSQAAEYYSGYRENHENWICSFLAGGWSWLSLTYWTNYNYGYGAIFIRYLIDRYDDGVIKNMCSTDKVGIAAVEAATGEDFNTIFYNFSRALVLSGTGATDDPRYNFKTLNLQTIQSVGRRKGLVPDGPFSPGDGGMIQMYPYEIYFTDWTGEFGTMQLSGDLAGDVFGITP